MATTLVATALHGKHSIKTKNQCSCHEKRMNEQRNISLQGKSLAFRQHRRQSLRRTGDVWTYNIEIEHPTNGFMNY